MKIYSFRQNPNLIHFVFSAYYRVNYDVTLWNALTNALSNNHTTIDVLNRAQIVDDALNLARAGEISYAQAFRIVDYLRNETEYYPWLSALTAFDFLSRVLGETSPVGARINVLQRELIQTARNNVSFTMNATNHIETLRARLILGRACRLGEGTCVSEVSNIFRNFTSGAR